MAKYHFNSVTGRVGQCRATKKGCPLGGDTPHFDTKEEAKAYVEAEAKSSNQAFTKLSKNAAGKKGSEIDDITAAQNRFKVEMMQFEEEYQGNRNMDNTYGDGSYRTGVELKRIADEFEKSGFSDEAFEKFNGELADIAAATDLAVKRAYNTNDYNELEYMDGAKDMVNRMADISEEYDSATFWAKKRAAQEAAKASENTPEPATPNLEELRKEFKNNYKGMMTRGETFLNKSEMSDLERIGNGGKVPAARLDKLIDRLRFAGVDDSFARSGEAEKGKQVLDTLRAARAQDPTPSTLVRSSDFDPSKQTVFDFSKNKHHDDVKYAVDKMKRTINDVDHFNKLRQDHEALSRLKGNTPEERDKLINSAKVFEERGNRAKALSNAQVKEFTYKYNNDPEFSKNMTPAQRRYMDTIYNDNNNSDEPLPEVKTIR